MSPPPPKGLSPRTIVIVAIIEFVLLVGGLALYLTTDSYWGIVAAAVIGFAMFATIIVQAALKQQSGNDQR